MEAKNSASRTSRKFILGAIAITLSWLALYHDVIWRLIDDWRVDENYSHGFLVPLISAYAVWSDRDRLLSTPQNPGALLGGGLMLLAASMLLAGVMGAELYATRISLFISLAALTIYFGGLNWLRRLLFPLGLILFALPIPNIIFNQIALPLQFIASDYAARAIKALGIPALREGNVIELAQMKLQVVEACSGIRSLVALAMLAVVYAYFYEKKLWRRVALMAAVAPVAVVANAARVAGTGVMAHYRGIGAAEGFMHNFSGWVVFILAALILLAMTRGMDLIERIIGQRRNSPVEANEA